MKTDGSNKKTVAQALARGRGDSRAYTDDKSKQAEQIRKRKSLAMALKRSAL